MFDNWNSFVGGVFWIVGGLIFIAGVVALLFLIAALVRGKWQKTDKRL